MSPRVAVVHDYFTQRGGAERVALAVRDALGPGPLLTSVYHAEGTFPEVRGLAVRTSVLQRVPAFRLDPQLALPLLPGAFDRLRVEDVDAVVCSSTGFAHGFTTDAPKVVYCHNPPRWLYQREDYLRGRGLPVRAALRVLDSRLRRWDQAAARSATRYLVNSTVVRERVQAAYGIDAEVLPPPTALDPTAEREPLEGVEPGFLLAVGRPRGYKRIDVLVDAVAAEPTRRLLVVGELPGGTTAPNVRAIRGLSDAQLRWAYGACSAVLSVAAEDFGLTPVEGYGFGKPAVLLRAGGFLDTLVEGETGVFVESPTPTAVREALRLLDHTDLSEQRIREHGEQFRPERFAARLRDVVDEVVTAG